MSNLSTVTHLFYFGGCLIKNKFTVLHFHKMFAFKELISYELNEYSVKKQLHCSDICDSYT